MQTTSDSAELMSKALDFALDYPYCTLPNPRVGAVIVYEGQVIAGGIHRGPGTAHAEVHAIEVAAKMGFDRFDEAELYVTLEPCCHSDKRTPPCAPAVAKRKFKKVYIAHKDPNPKVSGKGIAMLKKAGIKVQVGVLGDVSQLINQPFIKNQKKGMAYVTVKMATTFDGKMADDFGTSKWITHPAARMDAHLVRAKVDAIAVGKNTIDADNPELNVRLGNSSPIPRRVVIFGRPKNFSKKLKVVRANGEERVVVIDDEKRDLKKVLQDLYQKHGICHVLVEGGPYLSSRFLREGLADEVVLYMGRGFLGGQGKYALGQEWGKTKLDESVAFTPDDVRLIGPDVCIQGFLKTYTV